MSAAYETDERDRTVQVDYLRNGEWIEYNTMTITQAAGMVHFLESMGFTVRAFFIAD